MGETDSPTPEDNQLRDIPKNPPTAEASASAARGLEETAQQSPEHADYFGAIARLRRKLERKKEGD